MTPIPSIGRIVHYREHDGAAYPAIITAVSEDNGVQPVCLAVFRQTGLQFWQDVPFHADEKEPGGWFWPARS